MADDPKSIAKSLSDLVDHLKMQKEATEKVGDVVEKGIQDSKKDVLKTKEAEQERQSSLSKMFKSLNETMDNLLGAVAKPVTKFGKGLGGLISGLMLTGFGWLTSIFTFFSGKGPLQGVLDNILLYAGKIEPLLGPTGKIGKLFSKFLGPLSAMITFAIGAWEGWSSSEESDIGRRIIDALQGGVAQIISSITFGLASYDMISNFIDPFFEEIKSVFTNISSIITDPSTGWVEKVGLVLDELWFNVKEAFVWWYGMIWDGMKYVWSTMADFFSDPLPMLEDAWNALASAFEMVGEWIWENFKRPITYFAMQVDNILSVIKETFFAAIGGILESFDWIPGIGDDLRDSANEYYMMANKEAASRAEMTRAYEKALADQKEEEFQENLIAQRKRLERLRRTGVDDATYQKEIDRLDRRFEDADQAARAREALGREGLLTASAELAENRTKMTVGGQPTTNLVPVTTTANVQNNTFTQSPIEPRKRNYGGREMVPAF